MPKLRPLHPELQKKAEVELFEIPDEIDEKLTTIRAWLAEQPHLNSRTDDQFLTIFLRGAKYNVEQAKEKIDMHYTVKSFIPEIFTNRDPSSEVLKKIMRIGVELPLPLTDGPAGPRVYLIRPGIYDANSFSILDVMKVSIMIQDILTHVDDNLVIAGHVGILDMSNVTIAHFSQFNPPFVKKLTIMSQEASPLRQKGFHYINTPTGFENVFNMFKAFMSEKNQKRLYVHGSDLESLYKHVPKRLLPTEYGGEAGPIQNIINYWETKLLSYKEFFIDDEIYGCDESKRPGEKKTPEKLFGVDGSLCNFKVD